MAVFSKPLTLLSAAAATLLSGVNGLAITKARDGNDPNVQCFPADAPGYVQDGELWKAEWQFYGPQTAIGAGVWLERFGSFYYSNIINGQKVALSINNGRCDKIWVDNEIPVWPFGQIETNCNIGPGGMLVGGSYTTPCGNYIIQFGDVADPPAKRDNDTAAFLIEPKTKVESAAEKEKRCDQTCYGSTSACFPPNWATCTAAEKDCLVQQASTDMGCLMAGNCVPDC